MISLFGINLGIELITKQKKIFCSGKFILRFYSCSIFACSEETLFQSKDPDDEVGNSPRLFKLSLEIVYRWLQLQDSIVIVSLH